MLISKGISAGEIIALKLVTSEEVLCKLIEETADAYIVSKPLLLVPQQKGLGLMQVVMSMDPDKSVTIKKIHVMLCCEIVPQLKQHYLETTSSIQLV